MVKVGEAKKRNRNENMGKFINFAEIGGNASLAWVGGWTPLQISTLAGILTADLLVGIPIC